MKLIKYFTLSFSFVFLASRNRFLSRFGILSKTLYIRHSWVCSLRSRFFFYFSSCYMHTQCANLWTWNVFFFFNMVKEVARWLFFSFIILRIFFFKNIQEGTKKQAAKNKEKISDVSKSFKVKNLTKWRETVKMILLLINCLWHRIIANSKNF